MKATELAGPMKAKCTAHRSNGEPCQRSPIAGATVCGTHGGRAPQVRAAAARRKAAEAVQAEAQAILAHEGYAGVASPLEELSRLANEALAVKSASAARVNALTSITTTSKLGVDALAVEIALYERAMDRAGRFLDLLVKSGFEERKLRLDEATAHQFVTAMREVLARLSLTPEQSALVGTVVPAALRSLDV